MEKKAIVFLADGFEETEALAPVDIMHRAGIKVTLVTINPTKTVTSSHNIVLTAEQTINEPLGEYDLIFLPGGMPGSMNLHHCKFVNDEILKANAAGKTLAAICAAPLVYGKLGLLKGRNATCYPGFEEYLDGATITKKLVTVDGNIITGKGAGASLKLGLEIVAQLLGRTASDTIASQIQMTE